MNARKIIAALVLPTRRRAERQVIQKWEVCMTKICFRLIRATVIGFALFIGFSADVVPTAWQSSKLVAQAEAVVGRPATPGSVAGVARRTTRRAVRRGY